MTNGRSSAANRARVGAGSLARRVNGISLWGVQWENQADPRQEIKRLIDELTYRRVLFAPHAWEVPSETVASVLEIRRHVVDTLKNVPSRSEAHRLLSIMARSCLSYLDNRELDHDRRELEEALTDLRIRFAACLLIFSDNFALDVEPQITKILPHGIDIPTLRDAMLST